MTSHTRTDPACRAFRPPRLRWQRWLFDRARGRACSICCPSQGLLRPVSRAEESA